MQLDLISMGARIAARRKHLGLSQRQLAERLNVSNNHISNIERGRENPGLDTFIGICNELKVTPDYLLLGTLLPNNAPANLIEGLKLCSDSDLEPIVQLVSFMIERNSDKWNRDNYI